jgi:hypothetical protein
MMNPTLKAAQEAVREAKRPLEVVRPRLLDAQRAADYLGISRRQLGNLIQSEIVHPVPVPFSRTGSGEHMRKVLVDRVELDRLIDSWARR